MLCDVQKRSFKVIEDIKIVYTEKQRQRGNDRPKKNKPKMAKNCEGWRESRKENLKNIDCNLDKFCKIR